MTRPLNLLQRNSHGAEGRSRPSGAASGGLNFHGSVRLVDGRPEVRVDNTTLKRGQDGTLFVPRPQRERVETLKNLTGGLQLAVDELPELPDTAGASVASLVTDLNSNIIPSLRTAIASLAAKVNQLLEERNNGDL